MFDLAPKQSRYALIIGLLLYAAVMAGLFAWLLFNGENTVQTRLAETPSVTATLAGKEPLVPPSWKETPKKEADELVKDIEKVEEQPGDAAVTEPATPMSEAPEKKAEDQAVKALTEAPKEETPEQQTADQSTMPMETAINPDAPVPPETQTPVTEATSPTETTAPAAPAAPQLRWQRFARPFDKTITKPRISIIVADLGLASAATQVAVQELPGDVTLAFSSSAPDLEGWVAKARAAGHEAVLTIPMEPEGYPQNDPGPNTLLTGLDGKENVSRTRWAMARSDGYVGIMPYMGEKFVTVENKLAPVMDVVKEQGLMIIDGTQNRNSLIAPLSRLGKIPFTRADAVIDLAASRVAIEEQLAELERLAKEKGQAVGVALPYPVTFEKLKAWIPTLEQKGFVLAPITAVAADELPVVQAASDAAAADPAAATLPSAEGLTTPATPPTTPATPAAPATAKPAEPDPNRANNEIVQ